MKKRTSDRTKRESSGLGLVVRRDTRACLALRLAKEGQKVLVNTQFIQ